MNNIHNDKEVNTINGEKEYPKKGKNVKGIIYVLISAVLFSLAGVLIKEIPWSAMSMQGGRGYAALAVVLTYMVKQKHKFVINKIVIISAACNFLMSLSFVIATKMTSAANAVALQFTEPIFVILLLWACFGKRPEKQAVIACITVFAGILFFFMDKMTTEGMIGNLAAIFSGLTYAVVFLTKTFEGGDFESALVLALIISVVAGAPWYMTESDYSFKTLLFVFIMGACQFGLAFIFLSKGLDSVSAVTASLTSTIEPILNPVLVAAFCGETIGRMSLVGAIIVLGAATAYNVWEAKQKNENTV